MKKLFKLTLALLVMPFALLAQSNYKPGYIVTPKGDTVKGFVDYREWDANPEAITFRKTTDGQSMKYGINDIAAFGVDKLETFVRYTGKISTNAVAADKVGTDAEAAGDTSSKVATVFLKVVEKGPIITLYSYKDDIKIRFYVGTAPGYIPAELIYRLTRTNTERTYQKQLSAIAFTNNELNDGLIAIIARSEYSEDNILDIVSRINHVSKAEFNKTHYNGPAIGFFAGVEMSAATTSSGAGSAYTTGGGTSYTSVGPQASLGIILYANPATRALQFRLEVSGAQNKFRSLYTLKTIPYKPTEVSLDFTAISVSPQVIYNLYNADNFKAFIGVGAIFSHFSYSNAYFGTQNHDGSEADIAKNEPFYFNTSDNAMLAKAGVQIGHHLVIYGAIQGNMSLTQNDYFALSSGYKQVGINYLF